jgi:hypothetical protein
MHGTRLLQNPVLEVVHNAIDGWTAKNRFDRALKKDR